LEEREGAERRGRRGWRQRGDDGGSGSGAASPLCLHPSATSSLPLFPPFHTRFPFFVREKVKAFKMASASPALVWQLIKVRARESSGGRKRKHDRLPPALLPSLAPRSHR
jgi:hypothetical protein